MTKPKKNRNVLQPPLASYFKPQGLPLSQLEKIELTLDEYEAIRLADYENMNHQDASLEMNISRPTFTRVLENAHQKIASAIVEGKAIAIISGHCVVKNKRFICNECNHIWSVNQEEDDPEICINCGSMSIHDLNQPFRHPHGHRRGQHRRGRSR
jgi:uncharacterized protein